MSAAEALVPPTASAAHRPAEVHGPPMCAAQWMSERTAFERHNAIHPPDLRKLDWLGNFVMFI